MSDQTESPFLRRAETECPTDLLALAANSSPRPIAFVRAVGGAILETARDAITHNLAVPILVGEADQIKADADAIGWDLAGTWTVDAAGEKGAIETAVGLIQSGEAFGLIKGQLHSDVFMGGIVRREAGIRIGNRLIHIFAMLPPGGGRPLLISDAAVNINPDVDTRIDAALQMAALLRQMGVARPKIAILSATESLLPAVPSSIEAEQIATAARAKDGAADFAGPLSLDLAISPESVAVKNIDPNSVIGAVAGNADGLIVPDIVAGNVLFKSLAYCAGGLAAGLVVGGAVPIILTSRSDPPAARLASLALAAIAGQEG
jgi:phosphate acetyltransferase